MSGAGAIYFWAKLPGSCPDDQAVVAWLVAKHGIAVIPGSSCGAPGGVQTLVETLVPSLACCIMCVPA